MSDANETKEHDAAGSSGQDDPQSDAKNEDWVIPAILVLVIAFAFIVIGIVIAVNATSSDESTPLAQTEEWSRCLRSEGLNVPLIEATSDGGFRITVDGSLIDDGLNREAIPEALSACADEAPDRIREFMRWTERFSEIPFLGDALFDA
ncbi:MAG: hypothetical protein ACR2N7_09025 [Acidimicrobiia bacterium]